MLFRSGIVKWCAARGMDEQTALSYTAAFFRAMTEQSAIVSPERVHELADEYTPGGLNWCGKTHLTERTDAIAQWITALDKIEKKNS